MFFLFMFFLFLLNLLIPVFHSWCTHYLCIFSSGSIIDINKQKITTTVPQFSGNAEDFPQYEMMLQSTLELLGIGYVLTTNPGDLLPDDDAVLDPTNDEDKKKLKWT